MSKGEAKHEERTREVEGFENVLNEMHSTAAEQSTAILRDYAKQKKAALKDRNQIVAGAIALRETNDAMMEKLKDIEMSLVDQTYALINSFDRACVGRALASQPLFRLRASVKGWGGHGRCCGGWQARCCVAPRNSERASQDARSFASGQRWREGISHFASLR